MPLFPSLPEFLNGSGIVHIARMYIINYAAGVLAMMYSMSELPCR